jgi:Fe-S oxidoreductase
MSNNITKCTNCGLCKANCPVYKVLLEEKHSPRGKSYLQKENLKSNLFYFCTLCGACKIGCPNDVDLELLKIRKVLVKEGIKIPENEKMIENIRKYGNPLGINVQEEIQDLDIEKKSD